MLVADHYDRVTEAWRLVMGADFHYGVFAEAGWPLERATQRLSELLFEGGAPRSGERVLDVGCGVGGPALWLAGQFDGTIHGISISARGIEAAQARAAEAGRADRCTFAVADALDNGEPDASVDVAWVMESSHLMPDRERLLLECARVLKPGGRLVLCDLMFIRPFQLAEILGERRDLACLDRVFGRARIGTVETYHAQTVAAGLEVVSVRDLSRETRPTLSAWQANLQRHGDAVDALIGADARTDFARACDILAGYWDVGRMGYFLLVARKPGGPA
ncbi:MAG: methyltransferase domain-containing protein [bacterium]